MPIRSSRKQVKLCQYLSCNSLKILDKLSQANLVPNIYTAKYTRTYHERKNANKLRIFFDVTENSNKDMLNVMKTMITFL